MIDNMVLIVSTMENFFVTGIEYKLSAIGIESMFVSASFDGLAAYRDMADLIIYFMDYHVYEQKKMHQLLKDLVSDYKKQVIVIGTEAEFDILTGTLLQTHILKWFERPLDMNLLLNTVAAFLRGEMNGVDVTMKDIMIIDDDVTYMQMLRNWLKNEYTVIITPSAVKALPYLVKRRVDLILLDYEMPEISGPEFLARLHAAENNHDIPVIFLTGHQDKESVMTALGQKPAGYLLKTIDNQTLHKKLGAFFAGMRM